MDVHVLTYFVIVILTIIWSQVKPVVVDNISHLQKQPIYQKTSKAIF